jgi:sigma-B regulation protein RsbU (phosphoserine phosphatase)
MLMNKTMPNTTIETPDWLREMETILEELNEGVVVLDDELRVIFANEALTRMGHFDREEIQGRTPDAIFPSEDLPYIKRQHESGHRYGRNRTEFYFPRKDGTKIPAIFSGRVIQGPDKQDYVLLIVTDISAQKGIEEQLRESNSLLQKRQDEMDAELALAAHVQQSLAPHSLIWKNLAVEAYYSPARTIGGDFGVVFPQGDDSLSIVLSDVSGHGVGSALMANRIYSETLHALGRKTDPGVLLREIHHFVHTRIPIDGFFFTMTAARFSEDGRRASFSAAGQPPAILVSNGTLRLLESRNGILGCLSETAPSELPEEFDLEPGDRLVLYTDGLVEVFNSSDDMLGVEGLKELLHESATLTLGEMQRTILDGVAAWSHAPLADDVSLVIVEIR